MVRIKLCGLSRPCDIEAANQLKPEYIGFVFARKSSRFVSPKQAARLKKMLSPDIQAVGVFVNEKVEIVADLLESGIIDMAQLHGNESESYIRKLREMARKPVIRAFRVASGRDAEEAEKSGADYVLLDSGMGTGNVFDWKFTEAVKRPYFLAGGLNVENVAEAISKLRPFAVDVSSGIETDGVKDQKKMADFVAACRYSERGGI